MMFCDYQQSGERSLNFPSKHIAEMKRKLIRDAGSLEYNLSAIICHSGHSKTDGNFLTYSKRKLDQEGQDRANFKNQQADKINEQPDDIDEQLQAQAPKEVKGHDLEDLPYSHWHLFDDEHSMPVSEEYVLAQAPAGCYLVCFEAKEKESLDRYDEREGRLRQRALEQAQRSLAEEQKEAEVRRVERRPRRMWPKIK